MTPRPFIPKPRPQTNHGPLREIRIVLNGSMEARVTHSQIVTLSTRGQLMLPQAIRTAAGLHSGPKPRVTLDPGGTSSVRPIRGKLEAFFHSLDGVAAINPVEVDAAIPEAVERMRETDKDRDPGT